MLYARVGQSLILLQDFLSRTVLQIYDTLIAVYEFYADFFQKNHRGGHFGHLVIWSKSFSDLQKVCYNNIILL